MERFENEEICHEVWDIQKRIRDLKTKYEGQLDPIEEKAFKKTIAAYESLVNKLWAIDKVRAAQAKRDFLKALERNAKEVAKWPKWKREILI